MLVDKKKKNLKKLNMCDPGAERLDGPGSSAPPHFQGNITHAVRGTSHTRPLFSAQPPASSAFHGLVTLVCKYL